MEKSRQQRRAAERRKKKRHAADVKAKASAVRRIALVKLWRERDAMKLTWWQRAGVVFGVLIRHIFWPLRDLRDLLFPKRSNDR